MPKKGGLYPLQIERVVSESDACRKVVQASQVLAVAAILVDSKDASAAAFYQHFGFLSFPGYPERLLLPFNVLKRFASAKEAP